MILVMWIVDLSTMWLGHQYRNHFCKIHSARYHPSEPRILLISRCSEKLQTYNFIKIGLFILVQNRYTHSFQLWFSTVYILLPKCHYAFENQTEKLRYNKNKKNLTWFSKREVSLSGRKKIITVTTFSKKCNREKTRKNVQNFGFLILIEIIQ